LDWIRDKAGRSAATVYAPGTVGPLAKTVSGTAMPTLTTEYNAFGLETLLRERRSDNRDVIQEIAYDDFARIVTRGTPHFSGEPSTGATRYAYDALGRLLQEDTPWVDTQGAARTVGVSSTKHMYAARARAQLEQGFAQSLDARVGRVHVVQDPLQKKTVQGFGRNGTLVVSVDAAQHAANYIYGPFDYLAASEFEGDAKTIATDELGRAVRLLDKSRGRYEYLRNGFGDVDVFRRMAYSGTGTAEETGYTYDGLGRTISSDAPDGSYTWEWDGDGSTPSLLGRLFRESVQSDSFGETSTEYAYEGPLGALSRVSRQIGNEPYVTQIHYNADVLPDEVTYPGETPLHVKYAYRPDGQVQTITDQQGDPGQPGSISTPLWTLDQTAGLDAFGAVRLSTYGQATQVARLREPETGRMSAVQANHGSTVIQEEHYAYEQRGLLRFRGAADGGSGELLGYDDLGRLNLTVKSSGEIAQYGYDARGNLTVNPLLGTMQYGGVHGPDELTGTADGTRSYQQDDFGNQYRRTVLEGGGTSVQRLTYTTFDLPYTLVDEPSTEPALTTTFEYDASHQRTLRQTSTGEATIYAGSLFRRDLHAGGAFEDTSTVVLPDGGSVDVVQAGTTRSYRYAYVDHQGSVREVTDYAGAPLESRDYTAFGQPRDPTWSTNTTAGYTGHEHDRIVGQSSSLSLINMRGRMYDPAIGRFLTPDPVVGAMFDTQGQNPYSYVFNSPHNFVDPSGFEPTGGWSVNLQSNQTACADGPDTICVTAKRLTEEEKRQAEASANLDAISLQLFVDSVVHGVSGPGEGAGESISVNREVDMPAPASKPTPPKLSDNPEFEAFVQGVNAGAARAQAAIEVEIVFQVAGGVVGRLAGIALSAVIGATLRTGSEVVAEVVAEAAPTVSRAVTLEASAIRFSQSSVNGVEAVANSMRASGWVGAPIDVVSVEGRLITVDNTRLLAAHLTETPVQAVVHAAGEALPASMAGRFGTATTWGEAVMSRIAGQNAAYRVVNPLGSWAVGATP
jgi:RHS repeat-associated protein